MFPLLYDIRFYTPTKTLYYTLVTLLFFLTNFPTLFVQHIYTIDCLFTIIQSFFDICPLYYVFNMFGTLKPSKHYTATSLLCISKRDHSIPQSICLLRLFKMGYLSHQSLFSCFELMNSSQSFLLSECPTLICVFDDIYLIYDIYLTWKSPAYCHLRIFYPIVISSSRWDQRHTQVFMLSM